MNLLHLKYAVEVEKTRSISKAAENLFMGQPNLSRAIKDLEEELGITIFQRNSKGIAPTPEGEEFLQYARGILRQVEAVEALYKEGKTKTQRFSICVPRASYISRALERFAATLKLEEGAEILYKETNSSRTIQNVLKEEYALGIVRYQSAFEDYYRPYFRQKKLKAEVVADFRYLLITSRSSPLASMAEIKPETLKGFIEIAHADPYVPSLPVIDVRKAELSACVDKRIYVFERGSQFGLLSSVPSTFMWVSPVQQDLLDRYDLVQLDCAFDARRYKDVLIYRNGYRLTDMDKAFITELCATKRDILGE